MTYNLDSLQAEYLIGADKITLVVPLRKQPPEGWKILHDYGTETIFFETNKPTDTATIRRQYYLGSKVGLRETWGKLYAKPQLTRIIFCYKADYHSDKDTAWLSSLRWRSPATMPSSAIRHWGTVTGNRVCQVKEFPLHKIPLVLGITSGKFGSKELQDWYLNRYRRRNVKPNLNDYVEVATLRKD